MLKAHFNHIVYKPQPQNETTPLYFLAHLDRKLQSDVFTLVCQEGDSTGGHLVEVRGEITHHSGIIRLL